MSGTLPPVVFLGPSLSPADAGRMVPGVEYRPPARRGDLDAVDESKVAEVVLIDGVMVYGHPPSPMEVHRLAERGVRVLGASSLGALRAAELTGYGVEGVGWVFGQVRSGQLTADDELLARLDPRTGRAETLFLVNLRYAARQLVLAGALSSDKAGLFLSSVAALYFEARTCPRTRDVAASAGLDNVLFERLLEPRYDIKAADARLALRSTRWAQCSRDGRTG